MNATTARPGRVDYRPRLEPSAEYWTEPDGTEGVTVLRTHDTDQAFALAAACMRERRLHGNGEHLDAGELVWLARDRGRNWGRVGPGKRGSVPAVVFRVIGS